MFVYNVFLSSDSPICMKNTICMLAWANAVTKRISMPVVADKSNIRTERATTVRISENTYPITCFIGNSCFILHQSFQVDKAENEDPNNV